MRCVAHEDVSARRRAEREVSFQARLLNTVGEAVIATDLTGGVTYWNRFAERLYGWSRAEIMGRDIASLVLPDTARDSVAEIRRRVVDGQRRSDELLLRRRDGTEFVGLVTNTAVVDEEGKTVGIIGVTNDITDRKRAENFQHGLDE